MAQWDRSTWTFVAIIAACSLTAALLMTFLEYLAAIPASFYPILFVILVLALAYWLDRNRWRWSVRDLCVLLSVVSIVMAIIVAVLR